MAELQKDYPWTKSPLVSCGPMRLVALSKLATEVSAAGGLGFIGIGNDASTMEDELEKAKQQAAQSNTLRHHKDVLPVGVGFLLWAGDKLLEEALPILKKYKPAAVWLFAPTEPGQLVRWTESTRQATGGKTKIWIQLSTVADALEVCNQWPMLEQVDLSNESKSSFQAFVDLFSVDGRTLYYYHASQLVQHGLLEAEDYRKTTARLVKARANLTDWYKGYWRHKTEGLQRGVREEERVRHEIMLSGVRANYALIHVSSAKVFQALKIDLKDVLSPSVRPADPPLPNPTLDMFSGGLSPAHDPEELITMILHELKIVVDANGSLNLDCRYKGMRISYDPSKHDATSTGSRLRLAIRPSMSNCQNSPIGAYLKREDHTIMRFEKLLKPLTIVNATTFPPVINLRTNTTRSADLQYQSTWRLLEPQLLALRPITIDKQEQIVSTLLTTLRGKVQLAPTSHKPTGPGSTPRSMCGNHKFFGLGEEGGFTQTLRACFVRDDISADEREDLVRSRSLNS
ncbi:hypothetical protein LTR56_022573 [Elasticomyces elasticus]|nr:hypothetical protein LTR56_022573 [Elasticomyces elasticus]